MWWQRLGGAAVGATILHTLGVPAGALLGAVAGSASVAATQPCADTVPRWVRLAAFATLGWLLASRVEPETLALLPDLALPFLLILVTLAVSTAASTVLLVRVAGWRTGTALLGSAPGGLAEMIALSAVSGDERELVAALHLVRLLVILVAVPALVPVIA